MKLIAIGFVLLVASANVLSDTTPSKALVEQYLKQSEAEKIIAANVDGYVQQLSANASPEQKSQLIQFLNATIGWNAIKDQYASLVEKIFTAEELEASLAFVTSPVGSSITKKNQRFSQELAILIATNVQKLEGQLSESARFDGDMSAQQGSDLAVISVEEHNLDGKYYFTGAVENRGKRPARGVQIEVNLFSAGKFVDQYANYISGAIAPGATRYFKVSCGCKESPPAKHDSFKVLAVESY